jgi:hypothetical protein
LPQSIRPELASCWQAVCAETGAVAAVVAEAQDVEVVGAGGRLDLEVDRVALVDAHLRREALQRLVAVLVDLPLARRRAGLGVLAGDLIGHGRRAGVRVRDGGAHGEHGEDDGEEQAEPEDPARESWRRSGHSGHYLRGYDVARAVNGFQPH